MLALQELQSVIWPLAISMFLFSSYKHSVSWVSSCLSYIMSLNCLDYTDFYLPGHTECHAQVINNSSRCNLHCHRGECVLDGDVPKCQCEPMYDGEYCDHYRCVPSLSLSLQSHYSINRIVVSLSTCLQFAFMHSKEVRGKGTKLLPHC